MKKNRLTKRILLFLTAFLASTSSNAQVKDLIGVWTSEVEMQPTSDCMQFWSLYRLRLDQNGLFLFEEGIKVKLICEEGVGAYAYSQKGGTYSLKDSILVLTFNDSPVTYDDGPIFTSRHSERVRKYALERHVKPNIIEIRKLTKKWIEEKSKQPLKIKIDMISGKELEIAFDIFKQDGSTSQYVLIFERKE